MAEVKCHGCSRTGDPATMILQVARDDHTQVRGAYHGWSCWGGFSKVPRHSVLIGPGGMVLIDPLGVQGPTTP